MPKLLGCYEQPLEPILQEIIENGTYTAIIHIGCAEGYYAVGMARLMPGTRVFAYDINPRAVETCKFLAEKNAVADLFEFGTEFQISDFDKFEQEHVLIFCDIEGAELALLNMEKAPVLNTMDLIVETHDLIQKGNLEQLDISF